MEKLLTFMAERNKKLRKHDIRIMKLLFRELRPPSPIPFHYHIPSSNGNSYRFNKFLIIKITSLQKEKYTPRIRVLLNTTPLNT